MDTFCAMFNIVLLFVALLIPGFILGKTKLIESDATVSFSNILMYVAMPFLVFVKIIEIDFAKIGWLEITLSAVFPILLTFSCIFIGKFLCRGEAAKCRAGIFCASFPNCGFLGIPLAAAMWQDKPQIILYISVFNVVSTFLLLTVGTYILSGNKQDICIQKTLISPIFIAIVLGVLFSVFHWGDAIPDVFTYATILSQLATPLAMLALGYELSKMSPFWKMWTQSGAYIVSFIKLILSPLITLLVIVCLKKLFHVQLDEALIFAMMTATAVSTAASAPTMAKKYGGEAEYTAMLTLVNTLLCVLTLPLMYMLFSII